MNTSRLGLRDPRTLGGVTSNSHGACTEEREYLDMILILEETLSDSEWSHDCLTLSGPMNRTSIPYFKVELTLSKSAG